MCHYRCCHEWVLYPFVTATATEKMGIMATCYSVHIVTAIAMEKLEFSITATIAVWTGLYSQMKCTWLNLFLIQMIWLYWTLFCTKIEQSSTIQQLKTFQWWDWTQLQCSTKLVVSYSNKVNVLINSLMC